MPSHVPLAAAAAAELTDAQISDACFCPSFTARLQALSSDGAAIAPATWRAPLRADSLTAPGLLTARRAPDRRQGKGGYPSANGDRSNKAERAGRHDRARPRDRARAYEQNKMRRGTWRDTGMTSSRRPEIARLAGSRASERPRTRDVRRITTR